MTKHDSREAAREREGRVQMKMRIADGEEIAAIVDERIDSREWWVFVGAGSDALITVEKTFYPGEAGADFDVVLGPPVGYFAGLFDAGERRLLPLAFAHKRRMSAEQLHGVLAARGVNVSVADLEVRDIVAIEERDE